ncbi:uncharacterized protein [Leptinotarsa decemlineata]|uniref:uncharacterized protein n=1 Tax=Leptinotarsa decemlineata TaxID=7539 RepID=UPI003D3070F1
MGGTPSVLKSSKSSESEYFKVINEEIIKHFKREIDLLQSIIFEKDEKYAILLENKHLLNEKVKALTDKNLILQKPNINNPQTLKDKAIPQKIISPEQTNRNNNITNNTQGSKAPQNKTHLEKSGEKKICDVNMIEQGECSNSSSKIVNENDVRLAVTQAEHTLKLKEYIDLENDDNSAAPPKNKGWNEVVKKRRKRACIIGKNQETVKGVPKYVSLHVCRLDPQTSSEDLTRSLVKHFPEVKCEELKSRFPTLYSSFKVTIHENNFKTSMNPEVWPFGACISRFLWKRQVNAAMT